MDLKQLYTAASRDLIVLTSEVARLQLTISHFQQAEIAMSELAKPCPIVTVASIKPAIIAQSKAKAPDEVLNKLLSKASGVFSQSEIPLRKRLVDPAKIAPPKPAEPVIPKPAPVIMKTPEDLHAATCAEFEKVKRAANNARSKIFPENNSLDRLKTTKLGRWADRRVASEQAPEITDHAVNTHILELVKHIKQRIEQGDTAPVVLETLSLINWAVNGHLLTFWRKSPNSPEIHNA
jgi:hypothetical protein